jgi:hypothetical protein
VSSGLCRQLITAAALRTTMDDMALPVELEQVLLPSSQYYG